jgi:hypothetical protein
MRPDAHILGSVPKNAYTFTVTNILARFSKQSISEGKVRNAGSTVVGGGGGGGEEEG